MDMRVIEVTDFKSEVRFDLWDNLESNIGKLPLQVMRGSPLVLKDTSWVSNQGFGTHAEGSKVRPLFVAVPVRVHSHLVISETNWVEGPGRWGQLGRRRKRGTNLLRGISQRMRVKSDRTWRRTTTFLLPSSHSRTVFTPPLISLPELRLEMCSSRI